MGVLHRGAAVLPPKPDSERGRDEYVLCYFTTTGPLLIASADYASVIVLAVFVFAGSSWVLSARKWFIGPLPNVDVQDYSEKQT